MSVSTRNRDLEEKVANGIIQFIRAKNKIETMLSDKKFIEDKITSSFCRKMIQSRNAIAEFLNELCEKLNCTLEDLESVVRNTDDVGDIAQEDIEKLIHYLSSKKVVWKHILIGLGAASAVAISVASAGTATPLAIGCSALVVGALVTALSVAMDRMLDELSGFITSSRLKDIERACNLHKQYIEYGKYSTFKKLLIRFNDCLNNFTKTWKWEPVKL